ncbi:unnamed protein product [Ambrosiozyma monospora]|uniref:Mitochondrial import inner membrane translocase subunit TIM50 n=1 Tax=Ambrosiozyma monospora TaxID=43982 RepID=A0A9W6YS76_AMBMO|nr:unnamed protein product [Ambrosiozyma monospora]
MSGVIFKSALSLCKSRVPLTAAIRAAPQLSRFSSPLMRQHRFYAQINNNNNNNNNANSKNDPYKSSLLNDDLLFQAGIDTEDPATQKQQEQHQKETSSENNGGEEKEHDEFSKTKKRKNRVKSSLDKKKERMFKVFWYSMFGAWLAVAGYSCRDWDPNEEPELYKEEENGYTPGKIITRFKKRVIGVSDVFSEPAFTDMLPPPPPPEYRRSLTLVLELDDLLIHSEWDNKRGWKTAKRPGVDYFIGYLSQYYEIVIFTKSPMFFAEQAVNKLDPFHAYISYSLFREVCTSKDNKIVKDLSKMNRDLNKLILIDPFEDSYSLQPDNAIPIDKWTGEKDDKLIRLIPFLEFLALQPIKDVRQALNSFKDKKHIPEEFAEREKRLRAQWEKEQQLESKSGLGISKLLGMTSVKPRKMPLDAMREAGQAGYLAQYTFLKENGERMMKEQEEKAKELMAGQKLTLGKLVSEGMPTEEDFVKAAAAQEQGKA